MSETITRSNDFRPSIPFLTIAGMGIAAWNSGLLQQPPERYTAQWASPIALTRKSDTAKLVDFQQRLREALELSKVMVADDEIASPNEQTWFYAVQELTSLMVALGLPSPLILPLQNGGIGAEWHESGLNIELRFRKPYQVYAVLEDAQGVVSTLHDYDANLELARKALRELSSRK